MTMFLHKAIFGRICRLDARLLFGFGLPAEVKGSMVVTVTDIDVVIIFVHRLALCIHQGVRQPLPKSPLGRSNCRLSLVSGRSAQ